MRRRRRSPAELNHCPPARTSADRAHAAAARLAGHGRRKLEPVDRQIADMDVEAGRRAGAAGRLERRKAQQPNLPRMQAVRCAVHVQPRAGPPSRARCRARSKRCRGRRRRRRAQVRTCRTPSRRSGRCDAEARGAVSMRPRRSTMKRWPGAVVEQHQPMASNASRAISSASSSRRQPPPASRAQPPRRLRPFATDDAVGHPQKPAERDGHRHAAVARARIERRADVDPDRAEAE